MHPQAAKDCLVREKSLRLVIDQQDIGDGLLRRLCLRLAATGNRSRTDFLVDHPVLRFAWAEATISFLRLRLGRPWKRSAGRQTAVGTHRSDLPKGSRGN